MPRFLAGLITLLLSVAAWAEVPVPTLEHRVTDLTGTLTPDTAARLESTLAQFEQAKGSQIALLMVPTTQPEDIDQYGIRVAEQWKLGRKGVDDGAILIVAKDDHRVRIEVGYGLEGVLSDVIANRIINEDIVPRFKAGDFSGGVEAGLNRMMRLVEGEPLPPPPETGPSDDSAPWVMIILVGGLFGGMVLSMFLGPVKAAFLSAAISGALSWFLSGVVATLFVTLIVLIGIMGNGFSNGRGGRGGRGGGRNGWSGWSSSSGSSWSGSDSFGSSDFGGGGGGFGGGGSSGSW